MIFPIILIIIFLSIGFYLLMLTVSLARDIRKKKPSLYGSCLMALTCKNFLNDSIKCNEQLIDERPDNYPCFESNYYELEKG
jgi:hypothetical protein